MKNKIDRIIAKAWLENRNPLEMLQQEGVSLPTYFKIPAKPNFKLGEEIARNTINTANSHMDSAYCYCG